MGRYSIELALAEQQVGNPTMLTILSEDFEGDSLAKVEGSWKTSVVASGEF